MAENADKSDISALAKNALGNLKAALSITERFERRADDESIKNFDEDAKLEAAIDSLTLLKTSLGRERAAIRERVAGILDSYEGQIISNIRVLYKDFSTNLYGLIPQDGDYKMYQVGCEIPNFINNPSDIQTVCTINVGHLQDWGDGDFDYGELNTKITVRIPKEQGLYDEYKPEIEIEGEELDDGFKAALIASIKDPKYPPKNMLLEIGDIKIELSSTGGSAGKANLSLYDNRNTRYVVLKDVRPDLADVAFKDAVELAGNGRKIAGQIRDDVQKKHKPLY